MNPEEFDNRLRASFRDEYLPPKEQMWQNIQNGLDQNAKKPLWSWLVPALVLVVAGVLWLATSLFYNNTADQVVDAPSSKSQPANTDIAGSSSSSGPGDAKPSVPSTSSSPLVENDNTPKDNISNPDNNNSKSQRVKTPAPEFKKSSRQDNPFRTDVVKPGKSRAPQSLTDAIRQDYRQQQGMPGKDESESLSNAIKDEMEKDFQYEPGPFPDFSRSVTLEELAKAPFYVKAAPAPAPKKPAGTNKEYAPNEDAKWWFNFGIGPQLAYNKLSITDDSQAYVHKDLWSNKEKVTGNGSGIHMHASFLYKFGKTDYHSFSFESGLYYSYRTENIKMNESSYDIAHRRNLDNMVDHYEKLRLWFLVGTDTNWFNLAQAFSTIATNRYSVLTVPLRFQYEHNITPNTFASLTIGGGMSMIMSNKTTHYDLVAEKEVEMKRTMRFTGSVNSTLAFYTNYNAIGQIGIYTTFQSYLSPWKVQNKQYGITMSDLQFGLMFRTPLSN